MTGWVPRAAWTDVPARGGSNRRNGPKRWVRKPRKVVVHYVGSGTLSMPRDPGAILRGIQNHGWDRDGAGVEYNAMTFQDGSVWGGFEGEVGCHCVVKDPETGVAYNYSSWGICVYLGPGNTSVPDAMVEGVVFGVRHAQAMGWVEPGPLEVLGHYQTGFPTSCPGPFKPHLDQVRSLLGAMGAVTPQPMPVHPVAQAHAAGRALAPAACRRGSRGSHVLALQQQLEFWGWAPAGSLTGNGPGIYGPRTESAVRTMQRALHASPVDGWYGPGTQAKLQGMLDALASMR